MDCSKSAIFCVAHLIWEGMEKGHIDHTNTMALPQRVGGYSFSLKKKCQWGLIYDMQSTPSPTTPLFFGLISEPVKWKKEHIYPYTDSKKKNSLKSSTSNRTGVWLLKTRGNRLLAFYWQRTKRIEWETEKVLSGDGINAIFQSCNL